VIEKLWIEEFGSEGFREIRGFCQLNPHKAGVVNGNQCSHRSRRSDGLLLLRPEKSPWLARLVAEVAFLITTEPEIGTPIPEIGLIAEAGSEQHWLKHNIGNRAQIDAPCAGGKGLGSPMGTVSS
jgi:hypothetical protein